MDRKTRIYVAFSSSGLFPQYPIDEQEKGGAAIRERINEEVKMRELKVKPFL